MGKGQKKRAQGGGFAFGGPMLALVCAWSSGLGCRRSGGWACPNGKGGGAGAVSCAEGTDGAGSLSTACFCGADQSGFFGGLEEEDGGVQGATGRISICPGTCPCVAKPGPTECGAGSAGKASGSTCRFRRSGAQPVSVLDRSAVGQGKRPRVACITGIRTRRRGTQAFATGLAPAAVAPFFLVLLFVHLSLY